jgi:hypothetical protein
VKDEKNLEQTSSVLLSSQVEEAKKQLAELRLEESLGSELITNLADPQGSQIRWSITSRKCHVYRVLGCM